MVISAHFCMETNTAPVLCPLSRKVYKRTEEGDAMVPEKEDRRVRRTKERLRQALTQLLL